MQNTQPRGQGKRGQTGQFRSSPAAHASGPLRASLDLGMSCAAREAGWGRNSGRRGGETRHTRGPAAGGRARRSEAGVCACRCDRNTWAYGGWPSWFCQRRRPASAAARPPGSRNQLLRIRGLMDWIGTTAYHWCATLLAGRKAGRAPQAAESRTKMHAVHPCGLPTWGMWGIRLWNGISVAYQPRHFNLPCHCLAQWCAQVGAIALPS